MTYDLDLFAEGNFLDPNSIPWDEHHNSQFVRTIKKSHIYANLRSGSLDLFILGII